MIRPQENLRLTRRHRGQFTISITNLRLPVSKKPRQIHKLVVGSKPLPHSTSPSREFNRAAFCGMNGSFASGIRQKIRVTILRRKRAEHEPVSNVGIPHRMNRNRGGLLGGNTLRRAKAEHEHGELKFNSHSLAGLKIQYAISVFHVASLVLPRSPRSALENIKSHNAPFMDDPNLV